MKKLFAILMAVLMVFSLTACGNDTAEEETTTTAEKTIYVLGPTPDHGWTAQAGTYAQAKAEEITAAGEYKSEYIAASNGEQQNDQINTIIANGDAAVVVMMALDDTAQSGQEALAAAGIPFISFDRIIAAVEDKAILNFSGNNWQCGAGIAYWLQQNGMKAGDTVVVLYGDTGSVCVRRQEGFEQFLKGEIDYEDAQAGTFHTSEVWTDDQINAVFTDYTTVCDWSADKAQAYMEAKLSEIVDAATANGGNLYIYSMDDEMTFGVINVLEAYGDEKAEALNISISAIGGMQELYDVMSGADATKAAVADKYLDNMMSVYFSPKMMQTAVNYGLQYLSGDWSFAQGEGTYEPVFIVDRTTAATTEGFTGH